MQQAVSDYSRYVEKLAGRARKAVSIIASATTAQKNEALKTMAKLLDQHRKQTIASFGVVLFHCLLIWVTQTPRMLCRIASSPLS